MLAAAGCGGEEKTTPEDVPVDAVAVIGDTEIPRAEFNALMTRAEKSYKAQKQEFPKTGSPEYNDLKNRAVAYLVQQYRFRLAAEERGVEVTDEEVEKRLEKIKKESYGGSDKKLAAELKRLGLTEEQARDQIRDALLQEKLFKDVTKGIKVTEADIKRYYEKNKAQFTQPATREVRHILVKEKAKADEIYAQLRGGADFAKLAKQHSQDPGSKDKGGKYSAVQGQSVPEFDKVAFELETGELSKPVKTQFGWHIIEAISDVKAKTATPLEDVKASIRQQLLREKQNEAMTKWVKSLEKQYEDEIVYAVGYAPPKTGTGATTTG